MSGIIATPITNSSDLEPTTSTSSATTTSTQSKIQFKRSSSNTTSINSNTNNNHHHHHHHRAIAITPPPTQILCSSQESLPSSSPSSSPPPPSLTLSLQPRSVSMSSSSTDATTASTASRTTTDNSPDSSTRDNTNIPRLVRNITNTEVPIAAAATETTTTITTNPTPITKTNTNTKTKTTTKMITTKITQWTCDYCKKVKFNSYHEALHHEEQCKKDQIQKILSCGYLLDSIKVSDLNKIQIQKQKEKEIQKNEQNQNPIGIEKNASLNVDDNLNAHIVDKSNNRTDNDNGRRRPSRNRNMNHTVNDESDNECDEELMNRALDIMSKLQSFHHVISREILKVTKIGITVGKFKKCKLECIAVKAKDLVNIWKDIVNQERKGDQVKKSGAKTDAGVGVSDGVSVGVGASSSTKRNKNQNGLKRQRSSQKSLKERAQDQLDLNQDSITTSTSANTSNDQSKLSPPKRQKKKSPSNIAPLFQHTKKQNITTHTITAAVGKVPPKKKTNKIKAPKKPLAALFMRQSSKQKSKTVSSETKRSSSLTTATTTTTASMEMEDDTSFLLNDKALLAEHRKAEFLLNRRKNGEERKITAGMASIFQPASKSNSKLVKSSMSSNSTRIKGSGLTENCPLDLTAMSPPVQKLRRMKTDEQIAQEKKEKEKDLIEERLLHLRKSAPKFPVPNHILGNTNDDTNTLCSLLPTTAPPKPTLFTSQVRNSLTVTPKYQCGFDNVSSKIEDCDPLETMNLSSHEEVKHSVPDALHSCLSSVLVPSLPEIHTEKNDTVPQLWSDKYAMNVIPDGIYGEENKKTAKDLLSFINDWKEHRQQAITAAEEAHRKRNGKRKKKRTSQKKRYDYDDDFFSDSEDEDGLCKVYILCGPVGCGKTSLAYAAAKRSQCKVVEINTTNDRGGTSLKRSIEECTQSHSTLAFLKEKNENFSEETNLQDTDDEEENNKPSLAIILIDEVDLLFESDVGFWQSLGNLAKKAKCPIILTAPTPPQQLQNSSSIVYRYAYLTRPSPMECASKMCQIARMENMQWNKSMGCQNTSKEYLAAIARMCDCDLRRIMNEMQLFNSGNPSIHSKSFSIGARKSDVSDLVQTTLNHPFIDSISPNRVTPTVNTVIQIRGRNFLGEDTFVGNNSSVVVTIGAQQSPAAQIINNNTILAVCPPCILPTNVNKFGVIKNSLFQRSLDCGYQHVVIKFNSTNGMTYRTDSSFSDDHISLLLNYDFPEQDFEVDVNSGAEAHTDQSTDIPISATELLKAAVDKFSDMHKQDISDPVSETCSAIKETQKKSLVDDNQEITKMMEAASNASDAALIEDGLYHMSLPSLAGALHGCGEGRENDSRVLSCDVDGDYCMGSSDTFMTRPITRRERFLYSTACEFSRGTATFHPEIGANNTSTNNPTSDENDTDYFFTNDLSECISDEESFLPFPTNSCAEMIPSLIRELQPNQCSNFNELRFDTKSLLLKSDRDFKFKKVLQLASPILTEGTLLSFSSFSNSYVNSAMSYKMSLDYIPTLRGIAAIEKDADEAFEKLKLAPSVDEDVFTKRSSRRTRRGKSLVRDHYFKNLIETHDDDEAKDLGENFTNLKLII